MHAFKRLQNIVSRNLEYALQVDMLSSCSSLAVRDCYKQSTCTFFSKKFTLTRIGENDYEHDLK